MMRSYLVGICLVLCLGCAGNQKNVTHSQSLPTHLLDDNGFVTDSDIPSAEDIFYLTPQTIKKIRADYARIDPHESGRSWFVNYIHEMFSEFSYVTKTTAAQQTMDSKRGNCLSLAVLTSAVARVLNIPHLFQEVNAPSTWDRQNGTTFVNKHVNVLILEPAVVQNHRAANLKVLYPEKTISVVDFFPLSKTYSTQFLMENQVAAMFYSNLAAHAFVSKNYTDAYWLLRGAIESDPQYAQSWNMLALIYCHTDNNLAAQTFYHALKLDPDCMSTINNLVVWLERWDQKELAASWKKRLVQAKKKNPFYFFDRAETAFAQENYHAAILLYRKAIGIDEFQHEFHFGLFKTYLMLQKFERAGESLKQAIAKSEDSKISNLYLSKLENLNRD